MSAFKLYLSSGNTCQAKILAVGGRIAVTLETTRKASPEDLQEIDQKLQNELRSRGVGAPELVGFTQHDNLEDCVRSGMRHLGGGKG